jgi:VanZ family protein
MVYGKAHRMIPKLLQSAFYVLIGSIVFLTVSPPVLRPETPVPHQLEHFITFFIAGLMFGLAFPRMLAVRATLAIILFVGPLEAVQLWIPGRHARMSDLLVNIVGALLGWTASLLVRRLVPAEDGDVRPAEK